ncbi:hypothetical protein PHIREBALL_226 [Bacillus phage Phireball]|nr:hypothetical protein PHIREBALL_226 [Bacillus phage Phireball]
MSALSHLHYELEEMKAKNKRRKSMLENQKGGDRNADYLSRVAKNYAWTEVVIYKYELAINLLVEVKNGLLGGKNHE